MHLLIEPVLYNSSTLSIRNYCYYNNNTIYYKQQYGETPIECVESREVVPEQRKTIFPWLVISQGVLAQNYN